MQATLQQANTELHELLAPVLQRRERYHQRLIDGYEGRQKITQSKLAVFEALRERRQQLSQARFQWQDQDYNLDVNIGLVPFSWGITRNKSC